MPEGFPKVKRHPSRQVKYVGGKAVFNCTAEGDPDPAITWLRGYVPLNSSDPRYTSPSNGVLEISDLKLEDTGKIQCIATNRLGWYYSRKTDLVVEGLCRFIRDDEDKSENVREAIGLGYATGIRTFFKPHIFYPGTFMCLKPLWRAVSKQCDFSVRIHWFRVVGRLTEGRFV